MSKGLVNHIAIVSESKQISSDDVCTVAAAVSKQVTRDFGPAWNVSATVQAFKSLEAVPSDYWRVLLVDPEDYPEAAGYHSDPDGQPLAAVHVDGNWPLTVSHEALEMLADPHGNRIVAAGRSPLMSRDRIGMVIGDATRFDYLVEICDPVQANTYAINGVPVSDFVLPEYYSSTSECASFRGNIVSLAVDYGGYVTLRHPQTGTWYQISVNSSGMASIAIVSSQTNCSLRENADTRARKRTAPRVWAPPPIVQVSKYNERHADRTRHFLRHAHERVAV